MEIAEMIHEILVELVAYRDEPSSMPQRDLSPAYYRLRDAKVAVHAWLSRNAFEFVVGKPYRKTPKHEPDDDWLYVDNQLDDHFMPIYLNVNGERFAFLMDVRVTHEGDLSFAAVSIMAESLVETLNKSVTDLEWRLKHLPRLLFDDAHCWLM